MFLAGTSDLLQVVTSATAAIKVQIDYVDIDASGTVTPLRTNTSISSIATTTVVTSPSSGVSRSVRFISIYNSDSSASNRITVQHTDGTTTSAIVVYSLGAGEAMILQAGSGYVLTIIAQHRQSVGAGRLLATSYLFASSNVTYSGNFLTGLDTVSMRVRLVGGGGSGGGAPSSTSNAAAGGGGAGGGYAEKLFTGVSARTLYAFVVGQGGNNTTGAGNPGADTTFTVGATTVTAKGGLGGAIGSASTSLIVLGGAAPALSTNGDINSTGSPGGPGIVINGLNCIGGQGGAPVWPGGGSPMRITGGSGVVGTVMGGGGNGGCITGASTSSGFDGGRGIIIIEELS